MVASVGATPRDTIRKILKACFTRDLALVYSYSGMGEGRRRSKHAFGDHAICVKILGEWDSIWIKSLFISIVCRSIDTVCQTAFYT
jgi:hypothetical protein